MGLDLRQRMIKLLVKALVCVAVVLLAVQLGAVDVSYACHNHGDGKDHIGCDDDDDDDDDWWDDDSESSAFAGLDISGSRVNNWVFLDAYHDAALGLNLDVSGDGTIFASSTPWKGHLVTVWRGGYPHMTAKLRWSDDGFYSLPEANIPVLLWVSGSGKFGVNEGNKASLVVEDDGSWTVLDENLYDTNDRQGIVLGATLNLQLNTADPAYDGIFWFDAFQEDERYGLNVVLTQSIDS